MNPQPNPLISSQGFVSGIPGMLPDAGMGQASIGLPPPLQSHDSMGSMPSRISAVSSCFSFWSGTYQSLAPNLPFLACLQDFLIHLRMEAYS